MHHGLSIVDERLERDLSYLYKKRERIPGLRQSSLTDIIIYVTRLAGFLCGVWVVDFKKIPFLLVPLLSIS